MTLPSKDALDVAKFYLENVNAIAHAADMAECEFAVACALFEGEGATENIYGHDRGGAMSTLDGPVSVQGELFPQRSNIPVTSTNFMIFLIDVTEGKTSNGVGLGQLTYKPYFRMMAEKGLRPWIPVENAYFALNDIFVPTWRKKRLRYAFGAYNGGPSWRDNPDAVEYADDGMARVREWRKRLEGL